VDLFVILICQITIWLRETSAIVENSSAPAKNYNPQVKNFKKSLQMPIEDLSILTQRFPFRKPIALTAS